MPEDRDAADVRRVLDGDIDAFEGIVRRWQRPLLNLAYRFCRNHHQAEEMAQMAFVRAFQRLQKWSGAGSFAGWLLALATNVYRSEVRRAVPSMRSLDKDVSDARNRTSKAEPTDSQHEVIRHAVLELPAGYRDVLILFYFHDLGVEQTARCLGVRPGTVKARLHRARRMLISRLSGT